MIPCYPRSKAAVQHIVLAVQLQFQGRRQRQIATTRHTIDDQLANIVLGFVGMYILHGLGAIVQTRRKGVRALDSSRIAELYGNLFWSIQETAKSPDSRIVANRGTIAFVIPQSKEKKKQHLTTITPVAAK